MLSLTYYYSQNDPDQISFAEKLEEHCRLNGVVFVDICLDFSEELEDKYKGKTPVICIGPYVLNWPFTETEIQVATRSALMRQTTMEQEGDRKYKARVKNGVAINNLDRFSFFFSKQYVWVISIILAIFVLIPFLAPVLEKSGNSRAANGIYKVYHVLCHQLAFRSFFLYGEQPIYPRALAGLDGLVTYEDITGNQIIDLNHARNFIGDSLLGYKVAICERDVAIYGSLALFGIIFQITGKKIKQLHWYWWLVLALLPIAIDGFSQIPSLSSGWPAWIPMRESTPFLRILTGSMFGIGTGWYVYPLMEESMKDTRIMLIRKFNIIKKLEKSKEVVKDESSL